MSAAQPPTREEMVRWLFGLAGEVEEDGWADVAGPEDEAMLRAIAAALKEGGT